MPPEDCFARQRAQSAQRSAGAPSEPARARGVKTTAKQTAASLPLSIWRARAGAEIALHNQIPRRLNARRPRQAAPPPAKPLHPPPSPSKPAQARPNPAPAPSPVRARVQGAPSASRAEAAQKKSRAGPAFLRFAAAQSFVLAITSSMLVMPCITLSKPARRRSTMPSDSAMSDKSLALPPSMILRWIASVHGIIS